MANIFGLAGLSASDYQFVNTAGQSLIYEATRTYMQMVNEDVARATSVFVAGITEDHSRRYQLPGSGRMNQRASGVGGFAVHASGAWDVAFPIYDFDEQVAANDVDMAYMTPAEYERHVETIVNRYRNEFRWQILHQMFDNVVDTVVDRWGTLTIQKLANGDAVVYPPVLGSTAEATEDHYLASSYASASISDTNNPFVTIVEELAQHFGEATGGNAIAVFIHPDEESAVSALTDFVAVPSNFITPSALADIPVRLPNAPGVVIGRCSGAWVIKWRWIPSGYMLGVHLEAEAPLMQRVDPIATGLPRGLTIVAQEIDYPIQSSEWRARFGLGVANRLNGVVMQLTTGGFSVPSAYT